MEKLSQRKKLRLKGPSPARKGNGLGPKKVAPESAPRTSGQQPKSIQLCKGYSRQFSKLKVCTSGYERLQRLDLGDKPKFPKLKNKQNIRTYQEISNKGIQDFDGSPENDPKITNLASEVHTDLYRPVRAGYEQPPNSRPRESAPEDRVESALKPRLDTKRTHNPDVENDSSVKQKPETRQDEQHYTRQKGKLQMHDSQMVEPKCEGDHAMSDHDAECHAINHHDVDQDHGREAGKAGDGRNLQQSLETLENETQPCNDSHEEELTCEGNHERQDHAVIDHEIEHHVYDQNHPGETNGVTAGKCHRTTENQCARSEYPWMAPRVIWQYLEYKTDTEEPTTWSIDDYDGESSWDEIRRQPEDVYRNDHELSINQYHKLMNALYQAEGVTDELIEEGKSITKPRKVKQEWHHIKGEIRKECMKMYHEIEHEEL